MSYCFQAPWQWCWCFRPPILRFVVIFFSPHRLTNPNPGNLFDAKRKERGWPKPYGFLLGFLTTLLPRISVYLSFALFCSFFVGEINWNWNWRFSSAHKKMKNTMIYWPQGQWGGVRARYCTPVHSYAVKWSRNTKWKMTVDRLFTSRHQASFKMGVIVSSCSWSWFKVLTSMYVAWKCFTRTFPQL